jgi:hypothetical protein
MRKFLAAAALGFALALPRMAQAQAPTHIGSTGGGGSAIFSDGTETFTPATAPASGDLVCYQIGFANLTASGIATAAWSDASGSWTIFTLLTGANSGALSLACSVATGTATQFTITSAAEASGNIRHVIWHFRNTGGTWGTLDAHFNGSGANAQTSPHSSGSTTPGTADNVCIGLIKGGNNTYTSEAGWSALGTAFGDAARGAAGYLIQTSATAQAYDPTSSGTVDRAVQIACFDSTASGGSTNASKRLLRGIGGL